MRGMFLTFVGVAIAAAAAFEWRRRWVRQADELVTAEIARNRFRRRKGMDTMDEKLRDRTSAKRKSDEQAVQNFKRELRTGARAFGARRAS